MPQTPHIYYKNRQIIDPILGWRSRAHVAGADAGGRAPAWPRTLTPTRPRARAPALPVHAPACTAEGFPDRSNTKRTGSFVLSLFRTIFFPQTIKMLNHGCSVENAASWLLKMLHHGFFSTVCHGLGPGCARQKTHRPPAVACSDSG